MPGLRVGIVGCGGIAKAHRANYEALGARIAAVHDAHEAAAKAFAADCGARVVGSVEELVASGVDAVSVCSPPGAHAQACLPVIAAGIPLLCEKPLAGNLADARAIAQAARRGSAPVMVGFCHRFHGPVIELAKLVRSGALGEAAMMRVAFTAGLRIAGNHRADPALAGGGCVMDNGAHALDLFRLLVGDIAEARGLISTLAEPVPVEDAGAVIVRSTRGAIGMVATTFCTPVGFARLDWSGTGGTAILTWFDAEPELRWMANGAKAWTVVDCSRHPDRFRGQFTEFLAAVRERRPVTPSAEDGLAVNEAIASAYGSARAAAGAGRG